MFINKCVKHEKLLKIIKNETTKILMKINKLTENNIVEYNTLQGKWK